jgi:hypothetical protein
MNNLLVESGTSPTFLGSCRDFTLRLCLPACLGLVFLVLFLL